jgi:hypothetical protein
MMSVVDKDEMVVGLRKGVEWMFLVGQFVSNSLRRPAAKGGKLNKRGARIILLTAHEQNSQRKCQIISVLFIKDSETQ